MLFSVESCSVEDMTSALRSRPTCWRIRRVGGPRAVAYGPDSHAQLNTAASFFGGN